MSDSLSSEQRQEYKEVFDHFDKDKKGSLKEDDYKLMMRALGEDKMTLSPPVAFDAFVREREEIWAKQQSGDVVKHAFQVLDRNGDGYVSAKDLTYFLTSVGETMTQSEVQGLIAEVGGGESIDYNALVDMMQKKKLSLIHI
eukprot:TRINITY_DN682_c0_g1_i1.p1 TRINITY_DN682_c0_g1~~TRINITY_DN682_c0_g1_i1.p1  ORF type:complete len:142 (+),score=31.35 TRINITY_DN682_c0_g1_i1:45-470(+)